ncbi:MAG TPA: hypothetical protein DIW47_06950 [Bacteroidetes bacterium]|nr:hypothetical protein [Bacteroidota bacterium]
MLKLAKLDFKLPELLTDDEMARVLVQANELKSWASQIRLLGVAPNTLFDGFFSSE